MIFVSYMLDYGQGPRFGNQVINAPMPKNEEHTVKIEKYIEEGLTFPPKPGPKVTLIFFKELD